MCLSKSCFLVVVNSLVEDAKSVVVKLNDSSEWLKVNS